MGATASPPFDLSALAGFLAAASAAAAADVAGFELLAGGAIQENWGFEALFAGGPLAGEHRLVLRTDAVTGVASSLGRIEEFAVLRAMHEAGVTVAEPLWACADPRVLGKPFFVMRRVPGTAQGRQITSNPAIDAHLPKLAERLGHELALIQTVRPPRRDLAFLPMIGAVQHLAAFRAYLDFHPNPRPVLEWALRWLETHIPRPLPRVLCHRDFRTGNYMVDGAALTAVLDWEFAGWGDPDEDIGWLCCKGWRFARLDREAGGIADRAPFYRGYEQAAGRRLDPARVHFWEILANVRWAIIALQQSDRHLIGGARDLSTAIIGRRASECDLELLMLLDPDGAPVMPAPPIVSNDAIRDLPSGGTLLELGREWLLGELLPLVPVERHRELRLVATAMSIAAREQQLGLAPAFVILTELQNFYAMTRPEAPTPTLPCQRGREELGRVGVAGLLARLAADLRDGAFDLCEPRAKAARAILWRLTILKLREGNPQFLAANGFGE